MMNNKKFFGSIGFKYGSVSVAMAIVVVLILIAVNVVMNYVDIKWDLTPNKIYSISDTTKDTLKKLNQEVTIYGLFDDGQVSKGDKIADKYAGLLELLNQYKKASSKIKVEYVDPNKNPAIMNDLNPNGTTKINMGDFVVKSGKKVRVVTGDDLYKAEQSADGQGTGELSLTAETGFTGAIKYVISEKTPTIYFTEGHQEKSLDQEYKSLESYFKNDNYEVKNVNLITAEKVPDDASALIVLSPKSDLGSDEAAKINKYILDAGKVIFLFDSLSPDVKFDKFETLLNDYNISLNHDKVYEKDDSMHAPQKPYEIAVMPADNEINNFAVEAKYFMVMANSRSISTLKNQKEFLTVTPLIQTSKTAVGEQIDKSKGSDIEGPLDLAVAAQYTGGGKGTSKIVVIGNTGFVSDASLQTQAGEANKFFANLLTWMIDRKDDVNLPAKSVDMKPLELTQAGANIAGLVLAIVLPILIFVLGTFVWMRRRHL